MKKLTYILQTCQRRLFESSALPSFLLAILLGFATQAIGAVPDGNGSLAQVTVTGTVKDSRGESLIGATVSVKDQAHSTPAFPGQFPQFNSQFKYTGANPNENIVISIHNSYDELQTLTGTFTIRELMDQKIHDKWIAVKSPQKQFNDKQNHDDVFLRNVTVGYICPSQTLPWLARIT